MDEATQRALAILKSNVQGTSSSDAGLVVEFSASLPT